MEKAIRTMVCDDVLCITAYRFQGVMQPFPSHFHEHYVIGLVETGARQLTCRGSVYDIAPGDVLIFNPGDSHACVQSDEHSMDYRALEISVETMLRWTREVAEECEQPPIFPDNVIRDDDIACSLRSLHGIVMEGGMDIEREERFLLLLTLLVGRCSAREAQLPACSKEIERACAFMRQRFSEHISLEDICRCASLSKSTLLRAFAREKGITPYRYLEVIRMNEARRLLEQGEMPADVAARLGYADQSHLTNHFARFFGLTPGMYGSILSGREQSGGAYEE